MPVAILKQGPCGSLPCWIKQMFIRVQRRGQDSREAGAEVLRTVAVYNWCEVFQSFSYWDSQIGTDQMNLNLGSSKGTWKESADWKTIFGVIETWRVHGTHTVKMRQCRDLEKRNLSRKMGMKTNYSGLKSHWRAVCIHHLKDLSLKEKIIESVNGGWIKTQ